MFDDCIPNAIRVPTITARELPNMVGIEKPRDVARKRCYFEFNLQPPFFENLLCIKTILIEIMAFALVNFYKQNTWNIIPYSDTILNDK